MVFLNKIIQLTEMMTDSKIEAKPEKIVSGLEPEVFLCKILEYELDASRNIQNSDKWQKRRCLCQKNIKCIEIAFREQR
jgi:hypothetical protein